MRVRLPPLVVKVLKGFAADSRESLLPFEEPRGGIRSGMLGVAENS